MDLLGGGGNQGGRVRFGLAIGLADGDLLVAPLCLLGGVA